MSLNTQYGGMVIQWSMETFTRHIHALVPANDDSEGAYAKIKDCINFLRFFGDPRVEHYAGHIIKVKDHWFPDFQKWAKERLNVEVTEPEQCFMSMCIMSNALPFSIEDMARIKSIQFKEQKVAGKV